MYLAAYILGNVIFDMGDLNPQVANWMLMSVPPTMIALGITAVITGHIGRNKDERPRMAAVGGNLGIPAIILGGFLLFFLIVFGYL
jgi:hypothetical protein